MYRYGFILFWTTCALIVALRIQFDIATWFHGSTIAVRFVEPGDYEYLLHFPPGYTDFNAPRPLLIFLHGAGETNKGLDVLRKCDVWHYVQGHVEASDFPFIVVSPTTPKHGWEPRRIVALLDELLYDKTKRWQIDETKIYLTGFSMGGFGTFRTACEFPDRFAAVVPVAGGGEVENAVKLKDVPTYAFHGDADDVVPYECSAKMIEAVKTSGNTNARLTTLHGAGHGIAGDVYRNPELYRWLRAQHRNSPSISEQH